MDQQVFRRSRMVWWALLSGALALLVFFLRAAIQDSVVGVDGQRVIIGTGGGPYTWTLVGVSLLLLVVAVRKLRGRGYGIRISDDGIADVADRHVLPWEHVREMSLEASDSSGHWMKLVLPETAALPYVAFELDGFAAGPSAVFNAAHARWAPVRAALDRELETDSETDS